MRAKFELAEVVRLFGNQLSVSDKLNVRQVKVLNSIVNCRTAALGGHEEACDSCGSVRNSYNSCGDRHCPKCQAARQAFWIDDLAHNTLPVKHFHIVFTVPHHLNQLCLYNPRMYYELLFSAVWHTLRLFGYTHYGVESGAVAVLHTWDRISRFTLIFIALCLLPVTRWMENGKPSERMVIFCTLCIR